MVTAPHSSGITAEEFLLMPESEGHELVDGQLLEVPSGFASSCIGGELFGRMRDFAMPRKLGIVAPQETGIQIWEDEPNRVRKPDVLFLKAGRLAGDYPEGWLRIVPDFVAEIVSPRDQADELERKLFDYERAGVPLIWVIYPGARRGHIIRRGEPREEIGPEGIFDGGDIIPGFSCSLGDLLAAASAD